tara:strand:- start:174 stop:410 length:237 start_codon:yes stop_codon:yes gene_type:complete
MGNITHSPGNNKTKAAICGIVLLLEILAAKRCFSNPEYTLHLPPSTPEAERVTSNVSYDSTLPSQQYREVPTIDYLSK